jgi:nucleoside-diphosphate-sugar epimerase
VNPDSRLFIAGHRGLLGSALLRRLERDGYRKVLTVPKSDLDLTRAGDVEQYFLRERPEHVFLCAARVGGIEANRSRPADFILENLLIQSSVIHAAWKAGVKRLLFFGGACLYPRDCPQPMKEEMLGTGPMEPTSIAYSTAKMAGLTMCESYNRQHGTQFVSVIPATLYGPGDNFDPASSHVLSALLRRFHERRDAASVDVWGSGIPVREFLYVDDLADACMLLMTMERPPSPLPVNVGTGTGTSIRELAEAIAKVTGFRGRIDFDRSKPDGAPIKILDTGRMRKLEWAPKVALQEGLARTYAWYQENSSSWTTQR